MKTIISIICIMCALTGFAGEVSTKDLGDNVKDYVGKSVTVSSATDKAPKGDENKPPHALPDDAKAKKRYEVVKEGLLWPDAVKACKARGGHLVRIGSKPENNIVFALIKNGTFDGYWIDATDDAHEGTWLNSDGQKLVYTNWGGGQPDNYRGVEHWARMSRAGAKYYRGNMVVNAGTWEDWGKGKLPYICEWDDAKPANGSDDSRKHEASGETKKLPDAARKGTEKTATEK